MRILYLPNSHCQQRQLEKPNNLIYPVRMAMEAQYYRNLGHEVDWGCAIGRYDKMIGTPENLPFLLLPHPDRVWTKAADKTYQANGNFKYPGTYIMSASGCSWGKCSFCVENGQKYEVRPVEDVVSEIDENPPFKEWFDDSATFPTGEWLWKFCMNFVDRNKSQRKVFGCNMRMVDVDYKMMKQAGFRFLLFGIESANQATLNRINKGVDIEKGIECVKKASKAGISCHGAFMFGIPGETDQDAERTLKLIHYLLRKGILETAQASLYRRENEYGNESHRRFIPRIFRVAYYPDFWIRQILFIHNVDDLKYMWRKIKAGLNG
jgi:anaerobic magnesium-protoporphyrin IX monomethyl ester cyclase